jgi:hypothetical protein
MLNKTKTYLIFSAILLLAFSMPSDFPHQELNSSDTADQIHFTIISGTAITFDWVGSADYIYYGKKQGRLKQSVKASNAPFLPVTAPWKSDPGPYREARLTGLKQGTRYFYKIGSRGEVHEFRTPPKPGSSGFRVCLTTDMHESSPESKAMFAQIADLKPDLVLTTGDITGAGPDGQANVSSRFRDAMVWSQDAAWMPAWGNHDWEYDTIDDLRTMKGRFDIPNPGTISASPAVSCCGEDWGWFDYGNARFISLPEPWKSTVRQEWESQVSNYPKYRLDLSGHNHQYERYVLADGMTYIVNMSTGSYYHEGWQTPVEPENCAFRAIHYGILVLDFSEDMIHGHFDCSVNSVNPNPDYKPLEEKVCTKPGEVIDSFIVEAG